MPKRRPPAPLVRGVSALWSTLSASARGLSSRGWVDSTQLPVRVVSVGNIQAGGAGKTPLVARIAIEAHERGLKACILCRGYGGEWEFSGGLLLPDRAAPPAAQCGDEAALLHDLAPQALIGVGADRLAQFERAWQGPGSIDLVILDDGFQHWKIRKDLEIVALTSHGPSEVVYRDSFSALARADLLVWTKGEVQPPGPEGKPRVKVRYRLARPTIDRSHWLVTGVADSMDVERLARQSGYRIDRHIYFPDHARYAETMVRELVSGAEKAQAWIALTGKDWVKWRAFPEIAALEGRRVVVLEPELDWQEGREHWNRLLWG